MNYNSVCILINSLSCRTLNVNLTSVSSESQLVWEHVIREVCPNVLWY